MRVQWSLSEPSADLPSSVEQLSIDIEVEGESEPRNSLHTVSMLEDSDGNGRSELIRPNLPTGVEIRMTVQGLVGGAPRYVGRTGPFVLQVGERRYLDLTMYEVGVWQPVERAALAGRFLHTATTLPDGRVLIAGGFTTATSATACPSYLTDATRCHEVTAVDDAWIFDPATARFHPVEGGMLEARAGHTATSLPDGRVLLAGGASSAVLAFTEQAAPAGFSIRLVPREDEDVFSALATFEIFDPEANPELEDVDANGDPGRGGFVGAADDGTEPGRLDAVRFLAAAAAVPGTSRVVIAGGSGDPAGAVASTFTVFDAERAGGYGVIEVGTPALIAPRAGAGAAAVGTGANAEVWIVGGTAAAADADLAEVWAPESDDPGGSSASASTAPRAFPQQMAGGTASHPEWNLFMPIVEPIDDGDHVLVSGWYGPRCTLATPPAIVFDGTPDPTAACGYDRLSVRTFTIEAATGLAQPTSLANGHAFGASARLDDGRVVITGGVSSIGFLTTSTVDVLTGDVGVDGSARLAPAVPNMRAARLLHTASPLENGGVLAVGGITFGALDLSRVTAIASPEVLYLP